MARVEPDQRDQLGDHVAARPCIADAVDDQGLGDDVVDRHARVERAERVLENELHLAAETLQLLAFEGQHIGQVAAVVEDHLALVRLQRAQQDLAQGGLAAAAFTDQPEAFAARDAEADAVDRHDPRR